jgi:hypothetical protein
MPNFGALQQASALESESGMSEQTAQTPLIKAQSTAMVRAMARI